MNDIHIVYYRENIVKTERGRRERWKSWERDWQRRMRRDWECSCWPIRRRRSHWWRNTRSRWNFWQKWSWALWWNQQFRHIFTSTIGIHHCSTQTHDLVIKYWKYQRIPLNRIKPFEKKIYLIFIYKYTNTICSNTQIHFEIRPKYSLNLGEKLKKMEIFWKSVCQRGARNSGFN